ncbi:MAG: hypothetical protein GY866_42850 [Proteobacteria bacterium]|nr:hypothetical protein [Pseudomonadota bacterium]
MIEDQLSSATSVDHTSADELRAMLKEDLEAIRMDVVQGDLDDGGDEEIPGRDEPTVFQNNWNELT